MKETFEILNNIISKVKNKKVVIWILIIIILLLVLYPIIDANFLYYGRAKKRIEIIDSISRIDINEINKDERLENEYESILNDMNNQKNKNINEIIKFKSSKGENIIKAITASWIFILVGIYIIFSKDKNTKKRFLKNNILSGLGSIFIAIILGGIAIFIPIVINIVVTCILIQVVVIYLTYTISKTGK